MQIYTKGGNSHRENASYLRWTIYSYIQSYTANICISGIIFKKEWVSKKRTLITTTFDM